MQSIYVVIFWRKICLLKLDFYQPCKNISRKCRLNDIGSALVSLSIQLSLHTVCSSCAGAYLSIQCIQMSSLFALFKFTWILLILTINLHSIKHYIKVKMSFLAFLKIFQKSNVSFMIFSPWMKYFVVIAVCNYSFNSLGVYIKASQTRIWAVYPIPPDRSS